MTGIMGAMPEEIQTLVSALKGATAVDSGMRTYYTGKLFGQSVVVVFSRWGKVAAAATATNLILKYQVKEIIFTGVAGAIRPDLRIGDVVIGDALYQHDMDARPLMPRYEIPLLGKSFFQTPSDQQTRALAAANQFLANLSQTIPAEELAAFHIQSPRAITGNMASGDQFIASAAAKKNIESGLPDIACVEMEGAAVAQVCHEFGIPFTIIRTISDAADETSEVDFPKFTEAIASKYSEGIIRELFQQLTVKKQEL